MTDELLTERSDHVMVLTLNRPQRHHAINHALGKAIADTLDAAAEDPSVHAVVITGSGEKAFCAGQDMLEATGVEGQLEDPSTSSAYLAIEAAARSPLPLIAAINGYCYGGGAAMAIACDILLASPNASFRLPGAEYGLVVAAASFPRLVGAGRAKELIYTARKFSASEALDWGMLNAIHEQPNLLIAATKLASEIAANSPIAVRESKRVIDMATLDAAAQEYENIKNRELRGSEEQAGRFRDATHRVTGR